MMALPRIFSVGCEAHSYRNTTNRCTDMIQKLTGVLYEPDTEIAFEQVTQLIFKWCRTFQPGDPCQLQ